MKKTITLICLLAICCFHSFAQIDNTCSADFTYTRVGNTVKFVPTPNQNNTYTDRYWDFGDGTTFISGSVLDTFTRFHIYYYAGTYRATCRLVKHPGAGTQAVICSDSFDVEIVIPNNLPCEIKADFSYSRIDIYSNVIFLKDQSVTNYPSFYATWDFGDGTTESGLVQSYASFDYTTGHAYTSPGLYNVCRKVMVNNTCVDSTCKQIQVQVPSILPCNADFDVSKTGNIASVIAKDSITNNVSIYYNFWDFGDGDMSYGGASENHIYQLPGTYTIKHSVYRYAKNPTGSYPYIRVCTDSVYKTVTITDVPCNIKSSFSVRMDSAQSNKVYFTNLTTPAGSNNTYKWSFGDGTYSDALNPTHIYQATGNYYVCLVAQNSDLCKDDTCMSIPVQLPTSCNLVVNYSWSADSTQGTTVKFTNQSTPALTAADSVSWTFGDGTSSSSHDLNVTHTYTSPGNYKVCLYIKKQNSNTTTICAKESCKEIVVPQPTCNLVAYFSWQADPTQPTKIYFVNQSTPFASGDSIRWNFGDGSVSYELNPIHIYNAPGTYNVCIRVKKNNTTGTAPCVREFCKTIVITSTCDLVADFAWETIATQGNAVHFFNLSHPFAAGDSIRWTFGDGTVSYDTTPVHTYAQAGTYTVCIRVKKNIPGTAACVKEICKTIIIQSSCNLQAYFNSTKIDSIVPFAYQFTNLSGGFTNGDYATWDFGDGVISTQTNPLHVFTALGTYSVCLTVKRINSTFPCQDKFCKTIIIEQPAPCNFSIDFSWHKDSLQSKKIYFTNLSQSPVANSVVTWNFGDGTSGTSWNPDHIYAQPGTYTVCLKIATNNTCIKDTCHQVVVTDNCTLEAGFTWKIDPANSKKINFTNTSSTVLNAVVNWAFGDGTTATSWNAEHEYSQPGRYYVCLKIQTGSNCVKYKCDSITITGPTPACTDLSLFTTEITFTDNQRFTFKPLYQASDIQYTWTFGDGTGSQDMANSHRYAQAGIYTACLTAFRNNNCASTTCKDMIVNTQVNCNNVATRYEYQKDSYMPNKVFFYPISNYDIQQAQWTITKAGSTITPPVVLNQLTPAYLFADTGYYVVCLKAQVLGTCIKEYCETIHIENVANQCELVAYPNPANTQVGFNVPLAQQEMIHVYVYTAQNVLVLQKDQQGVAGNNTITLNVDTLATGFYTIKILYGNKVCFAKFQKL